MAGKEDQIKTELEIEGEKQYRQACKSINGSLREIASEMKKVSAEFEGNEDSIEGLSAKQDVLNKKLEEQKKKVAEAEKALSELNDAGLENSQTAQKFRIALNNAQAEVTKTEREIGKLENQISKTTPEYEQFEKAAADVDDTLNELASEMKVVTAEFAGNEKSADALRKKQETLGKVLHEQEKKVELLEKAYASAARDGGEMSKEAVKMRTALNNAKASVSTTKNEIGKLEDALEQSDNAAEGFGSAFEGLNGTLEGIGIPIGDVGGKLEGLSSMLSGIGINIGAALNPITIGIAAIGVAVVGATKACVDFADQTGAALGHFEAKTGLAATKSEEFKDAMLGIYKNNFGESLDDIADAMAIVAQTSGEVNPDKIAELAQNALMLRDVFGWDIQEQMRAVDMMMKQFGISGQDAFNLIAQGAQNGLDKNGDLLDTINEYSPHFKALGLDAEDMFNALLNGAESGTFSVDKLGDAMKEFGIRTKDGSHTTKQAFKDLGLNAEDMSKAFAAGGEDAAGAFDKVVTALFSMKDPLKQNEVGVALFGTMWEDLGATGIQALTNLEGGINTTKDALDGINDVNYNDIGSAWEGLGRTFQVNIAQPIGEKFAPIITGALNGIAKGIDDACAWLGSIDWAGVWNGITGAFGNVGEWATGIWTSITTAFNSGDVQSWFSSAFTGLGAKLGEWFGGIGEWPGKAWNDIKGAFDDVKTLGQDIWNGLKDGIASAAESVKSAITKPFENVITWIKGVFGIASPSTEMKSIGGFLLDGLGAGLLAGVETVLSTVADVFGRIWDAIKRIFGFGGESQESKDAKQAGTDIMTGLKEGITGSENDVKTAISNAAKNAIQAFRDELGAGNGPSEKTKEFGQALIDGINAGLSEATSASFAAGMGVISSALEAAINDALGVQGTGFLGMGGNSATKYSGIGQAVIKAIADGITSSDVNGDAIKTALITVANTAYESAMAEMAAGITGSSEAVNAAVTEAVNAAITAAETAVGTGGATVGTALADAVTSGITAKAAEITNTGAAIATAIAGGMSQAVGQITDKVPGMVQTIIAAFTAQHAKALNEGIDLDKQIGMGMAQGVANITTKVPGIVQTIVTAFVAQHPKALNEGIDLDKQIGTGMAQGVANITTKVPGIVQAIITAFTAQHSKFVSEGENMDKAIAQGMVSAAGQISGKVSGIMTPVVSAVNSFKGQMTSAGENLVKGIWQGFQNMRSWLESKVRAMMRDIVAAIKSEMKISSPSKVFAGLGEFMAEGLGLGFEAEMRATQKAIAKAVRGAVPIQKRGGDPGGERGGKGVMVNQYIYANETSYAKQQREAAKNFRLIARGLAV